jgi:hypothetical protein
MPNEALQKQINALAQQQLALVTAVNQLSTYCLSGCFSKPQAVV